MGSGKNLKLGERFLRYHYRCGFVGLPSIKSCWLTSRSKHRVDGTRNRTTRVKKAAHGQVVCEVPLPCVTCIVSVFS